MNQKNFTTKKQNHNTQSSSNKTKKIINKSKTIKQNIRRSFISTTTSTITPKNLEISLIDDLTQKQKETKIKYSKSLINSYTPLSKFDKIKELTEINNSSSERFKTYSTLFEQIKQEINDISQFRLTNPTSYNNEDYIEERDEEYLITPKYPHKQKITFVDDYEGNVIENEKQFSFPFTSIEIMETDVNADEQKEPITVSETKDYESMVKLKMKYRKNKSKQNNNSNKMLLYTRPLSERNNIKQSMINSDGVNSFDLFMDTTIEKYNEVNGCNICGCFLQ